MYAIRLQMGFFETISTHRNPHINQTQGPSATTEVAIHGNGKMGDRIQNTQSVSLSLVTLSALVNPHGRHFLIFL